MHALLIEDDPGIRSFVSGSLRESGFSVDVASDGTEGLRLATTEHHDVLVLDLMLPGIDGFTILRDLRARGYKTPVICLTALDGVDDRVRGLDLGADDYLAKPFSPVELSARIRALLRRGSGFHDNPIVVGDLSVDVMSRRVHRGTRRIEVSAREFALLEYLARNAGHVLSRKMILENVWDIHHDPLTNVVDVHIKRLRRKIDHGFDTPLIHTTRGVGYVLQQD
jgi:two-component system OmpR family response regulator